MHDCIYCCQTCVHASIVIYYIYMVSLSCFVAYQYTRTSATGFSNHVEASAHAHYIDKGCVQRDQVHKWVL